MKLIRFLKNINNNRDKQQLSEWVAESKANIEGLSNSIDLDRSISDLSHYKDVDVDRAWNKVSNILPYASKNSSTNAWKKLASIAAIFIIVSSVAYLWYEDNKYNESANITYSTVTEKQTQLLPDGSNVVLDMHTTLASQGIRNYKLNGRAFFDITKDPNHTFVIETNHGSIKVLGTSFNVNTSTTATGIYVFNGLVEVAYNGSTYRLQKGDHLILDNDQVHKTEKPNISPDNWKNSNLVIKDSSLKRTLDELAVFYNVRFDLSQTRGLDNCKINTKFSGEDIDQVLRELEIIVGLVYNKKSNVIYVSAFKC